jgi:hypothetical protein
MQCSSPRVPTSIAALLLRRLGRPLTLESHGEIPSRSCRPGRAGDRIDLRRVGARPRPKHGDAAIAGILWILEDGSDVPWQSGDNKCLTDLQRSPDPNPCRYRRDDSRLRPRALHVVLYRFQLVP